MKPAFAALAPVLLEAVATGSLIQSGLESELGSFLFFLEGPKLKTITLIRLTTIFFPLLFLFKSGCKLDGISSVSSRPPGKVVVYQDINYGGKSQSFSPGLYNALHFEDGIGNDSISSIYVPNGMTALICENIDGSGKCQTLEAPTPWIGKALNDKISYLKVRGTNFERSIKVGLLMGYLCDGYPQKQKIHERGTSLTLHPKCPATAVWEQLIDIKSLYVTEKFRFWDFINPFGKAKIIFNKPMCRRNIGGKTPCYEKEMAPMSTLRSLDKKTMATHERLLVEAAANPRVPNGIYYRVPVSKGPSAKFDESYLVPLKDESCLAKKNCLRIGKTETLRSLGPVVTVDGEQYLSNRCVWRPDLKQIDTRSLKDLMGLQNRQVALHPLFRPECAYNRKSLERIEAAVGDNSWKAYWGELALSLTHAMEQIGIMVASIALLQPEIEAAWSAYAAYLGVEVAETTAAVTEGVMAGAAIGQTINDAMAVGECPTSDAGCRGRITGNLLVDLWFLDNLRNPFGNGGSEIANAGRLAADSVSQELAVAKRFENLKNMGFTDADYKLVDRTTQDGVISLDEVDLLEDAFHNNPFGSCESQGPALRMHLTLASGRQATFIDKMKRLWIKGQLDWGVVVSWPGDAQLESLKSDALFSSQTRQFIKEKLGIGTFGNRRKTIVKSPGKVLVRGTSNVPKEGGGEIYWNQFDVVEEEIVNDAAKELSRRSYVLQVRIDAPHRMEVNKGFHAHIQISTAENTKAILFETLRQERWTLAQEQEMGLPNGYRNLATMDPSGLHKLEGRRIDELQAELFLLEDSNKRENLSFAPVFPPNEVVCRR